jgi:ATP-binding cassette subfamily F protein 3
VLSCDILSVRHAECRCRTVLSQALESTDQRESHRLFNSLMVDRAKKDLDEKRLIALRRSGARGKEARAEEIRAEEALAAAEDR